MKSAVFIQSGRRRAAAVFRFLGTPRTEVCLLILAAATIVVASLVHLQCGRSYSQWFIYDAFWFRGTLLLLGVSMICALGSRWPWKRCEAGIIVARAGILAALAGSFLNYWTGVAGKIALVKSESTDRFEVQERYQVTASWTERPNDRPYVFNFESGPVNWTSGNTLDVGTLDGMSARVLNFYQHAKMIEIWCADEQQTGGPLVRFRLQGPGNSSPVEHLLVDHDFGAELFFGPIALRLQRATSDALLADFLDPPRSELGEKGILTMYYGEHVHQAAVDELVGKTIQLGNNGVAVDVVHYLGEATLNREGKFVPVGEAPRNPLVELLVHVPNESKPFRQVAFAKSPLLNLDGVYERVCPVKFSYRHPEFETAPAIELLQSRTGRLYARTRAGGQRNAFGEVTTGSELEVSGFKFIVNEYLPHARRQISFQPAKEPRHHESVEPAARVEITVAGATADVWLQRNHPELHQATIKTPDGPLRVQFSNAQAALGFSLQLLEFVNSSIGGQGGKDVLSSDVRLLDGERQDGEIREISRSKPLQHNGYTFYQGPARDAGHGQQIVTFYVRSMPGSRLKIAGALIIAGGLAAACCTRASSSDAR